MEGLDEEGFDEVFEFAALNDEDDPIKSAFTGMLERSIGFDCRVSEK